MAFERDPKFYGELKQTNEDIQKVVQSFNLKSPFFDYTATFKDYIKQIEELKRKFPVGNSRYDLTENVSPRSDHQNESIRRESGGANLTIGNTSMSDTRSLSGSAIGEMQNGNQTETTANTSLKSVGEFVKPNSQLFGIQPSQQQQTNFLFRPSTDSTMHNPVATLLFGQSPGPALATTNDESDKHEPSSTAGEEADEDSTPPQPNVDKFEEPDAKFQARCKLYEKQLGNPSVNSSHTLLGCGTLFVKQLDTPSKLHLIIRQDPDLRKVLLNQVITTTTPLRPWTKAIQLIVPGEGGKTNCYIAKVKDDKVAYELYQLLKSVREAK